MPTKGNVRRITSTAIYHKKIRLIEEKYERAKKRKISQAVQRETPLRSHFPFSLFSLCYGVCLSGRGVAEPTCHRQAHAAVPNIKK